MSVKHTFLYKGGTKTKELSPIKAIRERCMECSNWSPVEVSECPAKDCALYPFRFGKDPGRKKRVLSDEQKIEMAKRLNKGKNDS